jgi:hypothetical protein
MGKQNRVDLKNQFSTGKIPTQGNYENIIDSFINLEDTDPQIIKGTLSSSVLEVGFHITASGNISASGYVSSSQLFGDISASYIVMPFSKDLTVNADISSSGNLSMVGSGSFLGGISASGISSVEYLQMNNGSITASYISASGDIYASTIYGTIGTAATITTLGTQTQFNVNGPTQITGSIIQLVPTHHLDITGSISASGHLTTQGNIKTGGQLWISGSGPTNLGHITASGDISSSGTVAGLTLSASGDIIAPNIGTGVDNRVVVLDSDGYFKHDTINSDVWDTSKNFVDASNGTNNEIAIFTDSNSVEGVTSLTYNGSTLSATAISAATLSGTSISTSNISLNKSSQAAYEQAWNSGNNTVSFAKLHFSVLFTGLPLIGYKSNSTNEYMRVLSTECTINSVILATSSINHVSHADAAQIDALISSVGNGYFIIRFASLWGEQEIPAGENVQINFVIL